MAVGPTRAGRRPVTVASRLSGYLRGGGFIVPIVTALFAFFIGGLVVALAGANPISTYKAIFEGTGLNWLLPWVTGDDREIAAVNLQQTLILTAPLILLGLAVAFAFRAGLFNIGGQGQYIAGSIAAVWIGSSYVGMPGVLHVVLAMVGAALAGALWGGIAGVLRATTGRQRGDHDDHAQLHRAVARLLPVRPRRPAAVRPTQQSIPVSNDVAARARGCRCSGATRSCRACTSASSSRWSPRSLFWVLLNRSVDRLRGARGRLQPRGRARRAASARAAPTSSSWRPAALLAGLAGSLDVLGWQFRIATNDVQASQLGFLGIAVALLGRNTAVGTCLAALLFGALLSGTSVRNLDPTVFEPELAQNLTTSSRAWSCSSCRRRCS